MHACMHTCTRTHTHTCTRTHTHTHTHTHTQGSGDEPYKPLKPAQAPIKPPYQTACDLKKRNLLEKSSYAHKADTGQPDDGSTGRETWRERDSLEGQELAGAESPLVARGEEESGTLEGDMAVPTPHEALQHLTMSMAGACVGDLEPPSLQDARLSENHSSTVDSTTT